MPPHNRDLPARICGGIERGRRRDAVDLIEKLLYLVVERRAIRRRVRGIGGLNPQLTNPLQVVGELAEYRFCRLRERDAVIRVSRSLVEATDLRGEALGDGETCRIVLRAVDSQARRQPL